MTGKLYFLFLSLIFTAHTSLAKDVPATARRAYEAALRKESTRQWLEAEQNILKAIRADRSFTDAYITYGTWLLARHRYKAAAALLLEGERLCPDGERVFAKQLARSLLFSGDINGALKRLPSYSKDTVWLQLKAQARFMLDVFRLPDTAQVMPVGPVWGINTRDPELFPHLSADGQTFYFTRRVNGIDEDFFYVKPDTCGGWQSALNMGAPPNTLQQEAAQSISADGHYLFFMRCDNRTLSGWDQGGCDLYMAYTADSIWSTPQSFGATINSPGYEGMPCLSSDNRELYFVSDREGGFGGLDIWSSRFEHGLWQAPRNMGAGVNTPGDETTPFIYSDNSTLYFASNARPGMGGSDLYISRKADDTTWGAAVHMGAPINTQFDEVSLSLNAAGDTVYFASDRDSVAGNFDLYQYPLPALFRPMQVMYVKGRVYDSLEKLPLNYANIYISDAVTGKELYHVQSNRGDGSYTIALPVDRSYHFYTDRIAYQSTNDSLTTTTEEAGTTVIRNVSLLPSDYQKPVTDSLVATLHFAKNSTALNETDRSAIEASLRPWKGTAGVTILVNGYTDNSGTPLLNEQLSYTRARLIASTIAAMGFPADIIESQGWGEASPKAENDTDEHRDMNRRVEIVIRQ